MRLNSQYRHRISKQIYELTDIQPLVANKHGDMIQPIILHRKQAKYPISTTSDELKKNYVEVQASS